MTVYNLKITERKLKEDVNTYDYEGTEIEYTECNILNETFSNKDLIEKQIKNLTAVPLKFKNDVVDSDNIVNIAEKANIEELLDKGRTIIKLSEYKDNHFIHYYDINYIIIEYKEYNVNSEIKENIKIGEEKVVYSLLEMGNML